ncbi:MAG: Rieske (2Fe-2S) protein [Chloroherpetonaceae bacterium]|nr:Rieske (2Fe-2S) protein [Chloroherpetonaceae bacterium]
MAEIVRGQFDRSKRLETITEGDAERRKLIDETQKEIQSSASEPKSEGRRNILGYIVGAIGGLFTLTSLYPVIRFVVPPEKKVKSVSSAVVGKETDVPPNSGKIFKFNDQPVFVLNSNGELSAMSAKCTHLGCNVQWQPQEKVVWCACHNAKYNTDGTKLSGPQPADLAKFAVKVQDGNIVLSKV